MYAMPYAGNHDAHTIFPSTQVITMPDARYEEYCASSDFIREHIFPGGHLPSTGAMTAFAGAAGLSAAGVVDIGPDYAVTLRAWRGNWRRNWKAITALGYPEGFMRKWCVLAPTGRRSLPAVLGRAATSVLLPFFHSEFVHKQTLFLLLLRALL
jgi:Mycolic acid cyclopropane synthetase